MEAAGIGPHDFVLVGGTEQPRQERRNVGVVGDGRRLDETNASAVLGMAFESGWNRRHYGSFGSGPALDRELRDRCPMAALRDRTKDYLDARRRGGAGQRAPTLPAPLAGGRRAGRRQAKPCRIRPARTGPEAGSRVPRPSPQVTARTDIAAPPRRAEELGVRAAPRQRTAVGESVICGVRVGGPRRGHPIDPLRAGRDPGRERSEGQTVG